MLSHFTEGSDARRLTELLALPAADGAGGMSSTLRLERSLLADKVHKAAALAPVVGALLGLWRSACGVGGGSGGVGSGGEQQQQQQQQLQLLDALLRHSDSHTEKQMAYLRGLDWWAALPSAEPAGLEAGEWVSWWQDRVAAAQAQKHGGVEHGGVAGCSVWLLWCKSGQGKVGIACSRVREQMRSAMYVGLFLSAALCAIMPTRAHLQSCIYFACGVPRTHVSARHAHMFSSFAGMRLFSRLLLAAAARRQQLAAEAGGASGGAGGGSEAPEELCDPITSSLMTDPVILPDSQVRVVGACTYTTHLCDHMLIHTHGVFAPSSTCAHEPVCVYMRLELA